MDLVRENRRLLAQVDFFSGDEHIRRKAEPWRAASPAARLAAMAALCRQAARFQSRLTAEQRKRADAPIPLPEDAVHLLAAMRHG